MTSATLISHTTNKIVQMLTLQDEMYTKINSQWREAGYEWHRAIWTECAELMDHYGWKWWKKQTPDVEQIKLEIVDIFHFGLSILLIESNNNEDIALDIATELEQSTNETDFKIAIEKLAHKTLETKSFAIKEFNTLLTLADMSPDELFQQYVGKNVLNFFRQDHGYKDGSYIKVWDGKEDNEQLADVLNKLDANSVDFRNDVYKALEERYPATESTY